MRRWCQLAVDGESGLQRDEGAGMLDGPSEGVVEVTGLLSQSCVDDLDFDARVAQLGDARAANLGVRIDGGNDATGDAGGYESAGARAGAAVVRAGFKRDVGGCSANVVATNGCVFQGSDF